VKVVRVKVVRVKVVGVKVVRVKVVRVKVVRVKVVRVKVVKVVRVVKKVVKIAPTWCSGRFLRQLLAVFPALNRHWMLNSVLPLPLSS